MDFLHRDLFHKLNILEMFPVFNKHDLTKTCFITSVSLRCFIQSARKTPAKVGVFLSIKIN